jgi:hypothetical protein
MQASGCSADTRKQVQRWVWEGGGVNNTCAVLALRCVLQRVVHGTYQPPVREHVPIRVLLPRSARHIPGSSDQLPHLHFKGLGRRAVAVEDAELEHDRRGRENLQERDARRVGTVAPNYCAVTRSRHDGRSEGIHRGHSEHVCGCRRELWHCDDDVWAALSPAHVQLYQWRCDDASGSATCKRITAVHTWTQEQPYSHSISPQACTKGPHTRRQHAVWQYLGASLLAMPLRQ